MPDRRRPGDRLFGQHGNNRGDQVATLSDQFAVAMGNIEPSEDDKDNAPNAHKDVRAVLEADETLSKWGVSPVLIGSYKRSVSIRRVYDVDVFCRLQEISSDVGPKDLLDHFFTVLVTAYGSGRVKRQARSVQIAFPEFDDLYVDAVPARLRLDRTWEIPQRQPEEGWQQTNPDEMTTLSSVMNDRHSDFYVPTVKLMRQTRRALIGKAKPGGLLVEMALYQACSQGLVAGTNPASYYVTGLEGVAQVVRNLVDFGTQIPDPTIPGTNLSFRATDVEWASLRDKITSAATAARRAYDTDNRCEAAATYRSLLGANDDHEFVFPLPEDCNADGTYKRLAAPIVAGDRNVPAGDRRFG